MIQCKNCKFWFRRKSGVHECRRNPPRAMVMANQLTKEVSVNGFFPPTGPDICCGEGVLNLGDIEGELA